MPGKIRERPWWRRRRSWFRAQALAWVSHFAADSDAEAIALRALEASEECTDPYKAVGSAAWALRALVAQGKTLRAQKEVSRILRRAATIAPPSSRSEALFLVFQAAFDLGARAREPLIQGLADAYRQGEHWRCAGNLVDGLVMLPAEDADLGPRVARSLPEGRTRRRAEAALESGATMTPRQFFW